MKLLMENWRKYLNERKSDIQYQKLVDFITELIKTEDVFDRYTAAEEGTIHSYSPHPKGAELWTGWKTWAGSYDRRNRSGFQAYGYRIGEINEEFYKRYKAFVGQDDPLYSWISFYHFFNELSIRLVPQLAAGTGGEMGIGKLNIDASLVGLVAPNSALGIDVARQLEEEWNNADPKFIYDKYLRPASAHVKRILDHEITHWINKIRAWEKMGHLPDGIAAASKKMSGSPADVDSSIWSPEYINSPDEVQARMIAAINLFKNVSPEYKKASFLNMDPRDFLKLFIVYYNEIDDPKWEQEAAPRSGKPKWWEAASEETKKKLIGRVLDTENGVLVSLKRQWRQENETPT